MIQEPTCPPHASLAAVLHADASRIISLESDLATALSHSDELANMQSSIGDWVTACHHQWDHVEDILELIHDRLLEMHDAIVSGGRLGRLQACTAWSAVQNAEIKLSAALVVLRAQSLKMGEPVRIEWLALVCIVESHRQILRAAAEGFGVRMEAWEQETSGESETPHAVQLDRPGGEGREPEQYARKFDQAAIEIGQEQHHALGLKDDIKALFMWVETPEERVFKNESSKARVP